jgi:23S rRNA pseudouridine2605 synthase
MVSAMPAGGKSLDRLLSRSGLCTRVEAQAAIVAGRVRVNGRVECDPDQWADIARDQVEFDGKLLLPRPKEVWALHKPTGYVTTTEDEFDRATVCSLLPADRPWLAPIGRLDLESSGLLLFTNDTHLAANLLDPTSKLPKVYEVGCKGQLTDAVLEQLRAGLLLHDRVTLPAEVERIDGDERTTRLRITIVEGRNRQIRKMLKAVRSRVNTLQRVRIGPIELGDLANGACRPLTDAEVDALRAALAERRAAGLGP